MNNFDYLGDIQYIEDLYKDYINNPESVDESWKKFFQGFEFARTNFKQTSAGAEMLSDEFKVYNLIDGYRKRGHLFTKTNPVHPRRTYTPTLDYVNFKLTEKDNNFLCKLSNISCAITSSKIQEANLEQDMIGTGPFKYREYRKGSTNSIILIKKL